MSCITEILKIKDNYKFLITEHVAIEDGGIYKGHEWLVTLTTNGHRCGYVAISADHPLNKVDLMTEDHPDYEINVHGGVTFHKPGQHVIEAVLGDHHCTDIWIGFDAIHHGDSPDFETAKKVFSEYPEIITKLDAHEKIKSKYPLSFESETIRTKAYMTNECKRLIDQISSR